MVAVQVTDVRNGAGDALAVHAHQHAQHAVRRGVLRPQVKQHLIRATLDALQARRGHHAGGVDARFCGGSGHATLLV